MSFNNPLALIGLVSVPIIIVLHLFKTKYKEEPVSSIILWQAVLESEESSPSLKRLKSSLPLILQILIAVLTVLALSRPYIWGGNAQDAIILIDRSMSMQALDVSGGRFAAAKKEAEKISDSLPQGSAMSLVVMDASPYIAVAETTDKHVFKNAVRDLTSSFSLGEERAAMELVKSLYKQGESQVYFISDRKMEDSLLPMDSIILGGGEENGGITLISHTAEADRVVALVKVKNFGASEYKNSLAVYADDALAEVRDVILGAGEEKDIFITSLPVETSIITARLTKEDLLLGDNAAYSCVYNAQTEKAVLFTERNSFLEKALSLMPNIQLYKGDPNDMEALAGYYLYIFDGVMPDVLPRDGHLLVINPPPGNSLAETGAGGEVRGRLTFGDSQLLSHISGMDMGILAAREIKPPIWADVIVSGGDTPLIMTGEKDGKKVAVFSFDLHDSDLPLKKEFPILIYNLSQWFVPQSLFRGGEVFAGDKVEFHISPDAEAVNIALPDDSVVKLAPPFPVPVFTNTGQPGIYVLEQLMAGRSVYSSFAVNPQRGESDIYGGEPGRYPSGEEAGGMGKSRYDFLPFILLLLIIGIVVEWQVYSRG